MPKRKLIGLLVILAIIAGAIVVFATKGDDKNKASTDTNTSASTPATTPQSNDSASAFAPVSNAGQPFKATISTDGQTQATIASDGKGNTSYSATQNGQSVKIVYTSDAYYVCTGGTCYKYNSGTSPLFNPSAYQYDASKLAGYKNNATSQGQQSCASGTCDVWSVNVNGATSSIFIDSGTKRITQVESTTSGKTFKVVYDYTDVTVDVPANAQTVPSQ